MVLVTGPQQGLARFVRALLYPPHVPHEEIRVATLRNDPAEIPDEREEKDSRDEEIAGADECQAAHRAPLYIRKAEQRINEISSARTHFARTRAAKQNPKFLHL